jgi:2-dehydro-3-deoxygluconokinase
VTAPNRVVCFGELLLRLSPPGSERFFQSPQLRTWFGGSEANVAVGLVHLGTPSEYVTCLPPNPVGDAALAALRAEGVETRHIVRGGTRLGIYFVESGAEMRPMRVVYDRAGSAISEMAPDAVAWNDVVADAAWLHLSGITPALSERAAASALAARDAARRASVPVSVDLNYRPALWGARDPRPAVRPLVDGCDTLIANPGAVKAMLGIEGSSPRDVAERVARELGCRRVAITSREVHSASDHGWSASLFDAGTGAYYQSQHHRVRVVDRVGGGDSFAAGLIHAILTGRAPEAALEFATAASALKLTIPGDFNRVSAAEVDSLLATMQG